MNRKKNLSKSGKKLDLRRRIINIRIGDPEPHRDGIFLLETSTVRVSFGSGPRKMLRFGTFALLYSSTYIAGLVQGSAQKKNLSSDVRQKIYNLNFIPDIKNIIPDSKKSGKKVQEYCSDPDLKIL